MFVFGDDVQYFAGLGVVHYSGLVVGLGEDKVWVQFSSVHGVVVGVVGIVDYYGQFRYRGVGHGLDHL